jgi:putative endonuclease
MEFTVYVLFSQSCRKFYSGQTMDFENRIMEHNNGETKSIKPCIPWKLVWTKKVNTRSEAMALERKIKSRGAARFLTDLGISI